MTEGLLKLLGRSDVRHAWSSLEDGKWFYYECQHLLQGF